MTMTHVKFANLSFGFSLTFLAILTLLHLLKPDLAPSWNFISEYEVGRYGWLMQTAFLSLGLSCIFLTASLWSTINIAGKVGLVMLLLSAFGMILAAVCKTDALNTPPELQTEAGRLHQLGAMLDQVPFAAVFITIALFKKKDWRINRICLILMLLLVWFGFVFFISSVKAQFPADGKFGPKVLVGWQNRIMIIAQAAWLAFVAVTVKNKILSTINPYLSPI
jgi:hypothetical protein